MADTLPAQRVLVVEDDIWLSSLLRHVIALDGYQVTIRHSAEDALGSLKDEIFDLILLDIGLPGVDGLQLCRHIRDRGMTEVPVVVCSELGDAEVIEAARDAGATQFLHKPFDLKALTRVLHEYLAQPEPR